MDPIENLLAGQAPAWGSDEDMVVTEEDLKESAKYIDVYTGPVTIISAQHLFADKCAKDENFHKFVVTVENADGEQRKMFYQVSFNKVKYGEKGTNFPLVQIKKLFVVLGFDEISATGKGVGHLSILKKYFGNWAADGSLPKWKGLRFIASFKYPSKTFHMESVTGGFEVKDADNNTAIFPQITVLDKLENKFIVKTNSPITGITRDEVKATAGQSGIILKMSELVRLEGIEGANNKLLEKFSQTIKPSGVNDAHAQVSDDDVAF
jgi:hypothetical protein